ncbi:unnamed protein product [Cunninghamella echinulata]
MDKSHIFFTEFKCKMESRYFNPQQRQQQQQQQQEKNQQTSSSSCPFQYDGPQVKMNTVDQTECEKRAQQPQQEKNQGMNLSIDDIKKLTREE